MPTLHTVPFEVLQSIAIKTVDQAQRGPPQTIYNLLSTCRAIHDSLAFDANPLFYANVYDLQFDTAAQKRRYAPDRLAALHRARELKRRWTLLKEIKCITDISTPVDQGFLIWGNPSTNTVGTYTYQEKLSHAWLAYMLLTESDGRNWQQLSWARLVEWIRLFMFYDIDKVSIHAQTTGLLPPENEFRAVGMWLWWLSLRYENVVKESLVAHSAVNRMLRPFTFASFRYSFFYAPWSSSRLPDTDNVLNHFPGATQDGPLFADPIPHDRTITLPSYLGSPLLVSPPHICQAAALLFFSRMQRYPLGQMEWLPHDIQMMHNARRLHGPHHPYTPNHSTINYPTLVDSRQYDDDVLRMLSCRDPTRARTPRAQPKYQYNPGSFVGEWEGRFVNYGLMANQDIGAGHPAPLHAMEAEPLTQDVQAWSLREFHHPSTLTGRLKRQYHRFLRDEYSNGLPKYEPGTRTQWSPPSHQRPPPQKRSRDVFNGFFPFRLKRELVGGGVEVTETAPGAPRVPIFYVELKKGPDGRPWIGRDDMGPVLQMEQDDDEEDEEDADGMDVDEREDEHDEDADIDDRLDIIIEGEWLYRGYITSNGNWIGRSRDTWTDDFTREGYEGVFVMAKRPY
ncbi:hypothetical protein FRB97_008858 [Tulasnella sp. 331]|nr:hypothetical protein FRB97_008858 [Tulasnella sp. 331]KAG8888840.1 hypothetical protein FRB98_006626 [Tulasnella sp. 332]